MSFTAPLHSMKLSGKHDTLIFYSYLFVFLMDEQKSSLFHKQEVLIGAR